MALDLSDCQLLGPALPEPFVRFELDKELVSRKLLPKTTGEDGKRLRERWDVYRRHLRELTALGGPLRIRNKVVEPLVDLLGYATLEPADDVPTREDREAGGSLLTTADGQGKLRVWTVSFNEDLDSPSKRGRAYRFSPLRIAQRVLLTTGERLGVLTNGVELRLLVSDPARPDSQVIIPIDPGWKRSRDLPDSFLLLLALANPKGVQALPEIVDKARLQQARVTKELRTQAREAIERFLQEILDHPDNSAWLAAQADPAQLARDLWHEGLITVYRLLFILKLESSDDPARSFGFASTSLWRNTFSPSMALAPYARNVLEHGQETGSLLEAGLRSVFRMFEQGLQCTELVVKPLGGKLFGLGAAPILAQRAWGERAVAWLLDRLLWTSRRRGSETRERVHYGPLDVEDLGRVYEALLELEPGISAEPMCRLRRQKLEVVVPLAQGATYRPAQPDNEELADEADSEEDEPDAEQAEETAGRAKKTKVLWIEEIPPHRFYLRVGLGRKASGSYYTPHSFVRFLVQETLTPQVEECSPQTNPNPLAILKLKVLDPAMGSGHFLVEACRFLADKLYEACRLCDEKALEAERRVEAAKTDDEREAAVEAAANWRKRIIELPDPDDELAKIEFVPREPVDAALEPVAAYLPSKSLLPGTSTARAQALCRRLVATHCLYGVDKNPLAVELAKLALWLESHAEGMPLTFLDHRLVVGDSLTGPFWDKLLFCPGKPDTPVEDLFSQGIYAKLQSALTGALALVRRLESSVGSNLHELTNKEALKAQLDQGLLPFRVAAAAWAGGIMLGPEKCDDVAYAQLLKAISETGRIPNIIESEALRGQIARGLGLDGVPEDRPALHQTATALQTIPALCYDLAFPEVFYPLGVPHGRRGFNSVLGNPPWEGIDTSNKEFFAAFDFSILDLTTDRAINALIDHLLGSSGVSALREKYDSGIRALKLASRVLYSQVNRGAESASAATPDLYQMFVERAYVLLCQNGLLGLVLPSAFHSNQGATGIRRLLLQKMQLMSCFSFENRRKLFEIHSSYKFAPIVARAGGSTAAFKCAFYLHDDKWLFSSKRMGEALTYSRDFVQSTTGDSLNFLELRSQSDVPVAESVYRHSATTFGRLRSEWSIHPTEELHLSKNRWRLQPIVMVTHNMAQDTRLEEHFNNLLARGALPLYEGKSVHQFSNLWGERPQFCVPLSNMVGKERRLMASRFFRLCFRTVARSTDERSGIFAMLPPGAICSNSVLPEVEPERRPTWRAIALVALANTFSLDWLLRLAVSANITFNFLDPVPVPSLEGSWRLIVHNTLRLSANDSLYRPMWYEQLFESWREIRKPSFTWPVLAGDDERWHVRAALDAVVADAYGLTREQYAHVLSTFSHASYPKAPDLCLMMFDQLMSTGLQAFAKEHDPYWDIPLNENLPQPVIDLPIPPPNSDGGPAELFGDPSGRVARQGRRRKAR